MPPLIQLTEQGLYCRQGDFFIDPWAPVGRAVITHAHTDHAKPGSQAYLASPTGALVLRERVQAGAKIEEAPFGRAVTMNGVKVSLHPAGHLLGSAQVRVESPRGEVWVVSGDYKTQPDRTCEPFELVRCHTFITESTFGLPVFRWRPQAEIFEQVNAWWRRNRELGRTSVIYAYALGKAQRVLGGVDPGIGPILVHSTVARFLPAYAAARFTLPYCEQAGAGNIPGACGRGLVIAPPGTGRTPWLNRFAPYASAFASGWMLLRGTRRRRGHDCGFVLSDHADWDGLMTTIRATGAARVLVTHGYAEVVARWLREQSLDAAPLATPFENDEAANGESGPEELEPQMTQMDADDAADQGGLMKETG